MTVYEFAMCWLDFNALVFLAALITLPGLNSNVSSDSNYALAE